MSRKLSGVLLCVIAQNLAFGTLYGTFGPMLPVTVEHFGVSLVSATMAISLASLCVAAGAPIVGAIAQRVPVHVTMATAAAITAACYVAIAWSPIYVLVLVAYGVLGLCAVAIGIIGPLALVNDWLDEGRGRALGLIHMPLFLTLFPLAVAVLLPAVGRSWTLTLVAVPFVLIIPFILFLARLRNRPEDTTTAAVANGPVAILRLKDSRFRALVPLSLGIGTLAGASVVFMAHAVVFGESRGLDLASAALLISLYSGFGVIGSPVVGWLCDRFGPYMTIAGVAAVMAVLWASLPEMLGSAIYITAAVLGFFASPINTMHASVISALYGPDEVGKAIGVSYLIKLPFIFGLAPLVAALSAKPGSYAIAFMALAGIIFAGGVLIIVGWAIARRRRPAALAS